MIVRKLSRDWMAGYASSEFDPRTGELELLDQAGKVLRIGWDQIKWICYLRDLAASAGDPANPEKLLQKRFRTRPRTAGLWLRITLSDRDQIEGIAANDASLVKGAGLMLTPPDTRSNTQRVFVPMQAIESLEVVGLIGAVGKRQATGRSDEEQASLFPAEPEAE